jgi:hypothetical protein
VTRALRNLREGIELRRRRRPIALNVERGVVRLVVFKGEGIVAWAIADPREGDPFDESPNGQTDEETGPPGPQAQQEETTAPQAEGDDSTDPPVEEEDSDGQRDEERRLARTIGTLLVELRAERVRLVTDLPLYIPLVRHIKLPELRRRFLEPVVMSEVSSSIPFALSEVDVKWQAGKDKAEGNAMAIVVQKAEVDAHVRLMKEAGKAPAGTYSQAAALGIATGVPDAMVVHLGHGQESVILVRDGSPQAVLQVLTQEGERSPQEKAEAMARGVEQMEGFDQTLGASARDERLPLVLTGEVPSDGVLEEELRQLLQRDVIRPSPPVDCPEGLPISEYASCVGLALLDRGRPSRWRMTHQRGMAFQNLLSERHVPTPIPLKSFAIYLALGLFAVGAFLLTPRVEAVQMEAGTETVNLQRAEDLERDHRLNAGAARKLQREAQDIRRLTLHMKSRLAGLAQEMEELGAWFEKIETITEKARPPNVRVTNLSPRGDEFTLTGRAPTLEDAVRYANNIRSSGLFIDVKVRRVESAGGPLTGEAPILGELGLLAGPGVGADAAPQSPQVADSGEGKDIAVMSFLIEATAKPPPDEESDQEPGEDGDAE